MVLLGGQRGFCGRGGLLILFDVAVLVIVAGMDAAGARVGVGAVVAVVVIVADVSGWSEFLAVHVLFRGLNGSIGILKLISINEMRRDSESDEKSGCFFRIEAAGDDGFVDAGNGELDSGGIVGWRQLQRSKLHVLGDGVSLRVVVAKLAAFESGGLALESVDLDVSACHVHHGLCLLFFALLGQVRHFKRVGSDGGLAND